jgi:type II secretory pathway pseudopilin PulG
LTLIELVLALALASVMMAAVVRVVAVIARQTANQKAQQTQGVASGRLMHQLQSELVNARGLLVSTTEVQLEGFFGPRQIPDLIRYEVINVGDHTCLVRRRGADTRLCWVGFGGFVFQSWETSEGAEQAAATKSGLPVSLSRLPRPPASFVFGWRDADGKVLQQEVIRHHE